MEERSVTLYKGAKSIGPYRELDKYRLRCVKLRRWTFLISIAPIALLNTLVLKAVRLRARQDAPHAFGSTYTREPQFPDAEWLSTQNE